MLQKLELRRSVWHDGQFQPIGSIIEAECARAEFLIEREKAVRVIEQPATKKKNVKAN